MNKYKGSILCLSLLSIGILSCSGEDTNTELPEENTITITGTQNRPETRISYDDDGTNISTEWGGSEGQRTDAFNVYGGGTGTLTFTLESIKEDSDGKTASFTAVGTDPGAGSYFAVYPAVKATNTLGVLSLYVTGQVQTGNANMNHLADKNYMTASFTTSGLLENASFTFEPLLSIIKFVITAPSSSHKPLNLTLSTPDNNGIIIGRTGNKLSVPVYAKSQTIHFPEGTLTLAPDNTFTVYMAVFGGTMLAGQNVNVNVVYKDPSDKNAIYSYSVEGDAENAKTLKAGYVYKKTLSERTLLPIDDNNKYTDSTGASGELTNDGGTYLIQNAADLARFMEDINSGKNLDASYRLTTDLFIEYTGNFTPIATDNEPFRGVFDGAGHTISGTNLSFLPIQSQNPMCGFFGALKGEQGKQARIENLNITISGSIDAGQSHADTIAFGGIAGKLYPFSKIENCSYNGKITSQGGTKVICVGGIVGTARENTIISNCFKTDFLGNSGNAAYNMVGGICGYNMGIVTNCSDYSYIHFTGLTNGNIGGICGRNGGTILYAWSIGNITPSTFPGGNDSYAGGLAGLNWGNIRYSHNDTKDEKLRNVGDGNPPVY